MFGVLSYQGLLITCRDSIITNMISQKGVWELAGCRQDNYQNDWKERFCRVESSDVSPLSTVGPGTVYK